MATLEISSWFGLVILVVVAALLLHQGWMAFQVGKARREYDVPYPTMYADEEKCPNAKMFNCVQRGHQNSLENLPGFLTLLILAGTLFPVSASLAGIEFLIGRVLYFNGYATGDPAKRSNGRLYLVGLLALLGLSIATAVRLLISK